MLLAGIVSKVWLGRQRPGSSRIKGIADIEVYQPQGTWQTEVESGIRSGPHQQNRQVDV